MGFLLLTTSVITIVSSFSPNYPVLLLCRSLEGIVLAGIPAIAMVYLGEEVHPLHLGTAMGLYIGGTAFGGMLGRVATGILTDLFSWRNACHPVLCQASRHLHGRSLLSRRYFARCNLSRTNYRLERCSHRYCLHSMPLSCCQSGIPTTTRRTGPVEGHINRLKLLRRQSYGRAEIAHLSRRLLAA
jgi:hypothetical protein